MATPVKGLKTMTLATARKLSLRANAAATLEKPQTLTPKKLGYTMPGEFEKHEACWMGWPYDGGLWRDNAKPAQEQYANVAKAISEFEPLIMLADPESADVAREYLKDAPNVTVLEMPINDGWTRDWGPSCIAKDEDGKRTIAGVHWDYDCYGGILKKKLGLPTMMPDWEKDYLAGRKLLEHHGLEVFEAPIHIEGGSIHSDGQGTLLVTEQCLLHESRNPDLGKEGIEDTLKEYLGLEKIIWLWKGVVGDDEIVNGHVDNFCCFVRPGVVLLAWTDDVDDPQYEVSMDAYERLSNTTDARGRKLEIFKLNRPPPMFRTFKEASGFKDGYIEQGYCPREATARLPSTYINHYCANGGVVCPQFGGVAAEADANALKVLQEAYGPDYKVVGVKSREIVLNAGNIHCITQQFPAAS